MIQGIRRRIVTGEKVMLGRLYFPKGSKVPAHRHENEQITHVLTGALLFILDGEEVLVKAGETLHIPSNKNHSFESVGTESARLIVVFPIHDPLSPEHSVYLEGAPANTDPGGPAV